VVSRLSVNFISVDGSPSASITLRPGQVKAIVAESSRLFTTGIWQITKTPMMIP